MGCAVKTLFESHVVPELTETPSSSAVHGTVYHGDAVRILKTLPDETFQACVTSPPYWGLRDYGIQGQIGAEPQLSDYIANLVAVFAEVMRVLRSDGTLWLNLGDSYTSGGRTWRQTDKKNRARGMDYRPDTPPGLKPKDLIGVPWRVAFALQAAGWYLRSDIIWSKPNALPESVKDRPTRIHEYVFLLSKSEKYYYDYEAVQERTKDNGGTRNCRSVWSLNTEPFPEAHFAAFPRALVVPCILAGSGRDASVLDPFFGSGTVGEVAASLRRDFVGVELNDEYIQIAERRLSKVAKLQLEINRGKSSPR
jgi:site-specific DNA-methyltransferase (cytosine-N4-specific)